MTRFFFAIVALAVVSNISAQMPPKRVPWTTSKIAGTPEPPHPYKAERLFPKIALSEPVQMVRAPGLGRWFVVERRGKIVSFLDRPDADKVDLVCDFPAEIKIPNPDGPPKKVRETFAIAFHPQFAKNRICYVCSIHESKRGEQLPDGTRISSFKVTDTDPPRLDVKSEKVLLTFLGGGHNGCDLQFGNDGMLYISTGDGANPNPPDALNTGQDVSDLLSSILRIDVDRTDPGLNYAIPKDNPFVGRPKTRGEIYAYGFRNPWRMSFDRPTGDLWVGDVGWELWEMIDRVQKGGNYGWPIKEGNQDVNPGVKRGPTPILPPTYAFPHTEAASITGGFVYRGKKFPELAGAYICGDFVSRKIWAIKFDKDAVVWQKELAQTNARIVAFAEDAEGEISFLDHKVGAGVYTLVPDPTAKTWKDTFPRKLSETGLFATTNDHTLAPGVRPYAINFPQWLDGATSQRFIAIPNLEKAKLYDRYTRTPDDWGNHVFPTKDSIFGKTVFGPGSDEPRTRIETQLLHFDGVQWRGYTYAWNDEQSDAKLVDAKGAETVLTRTDPHVLGGMRTQTWRFASRTECMVCHNPWAGFTLGFTPAQLDTKLRFIDAKRKTHSELDRLIDEHWVDLFTRDKGKDIPIVPAQLPYEERLAGARGYLHVNCAHCHQFGAGGNALIDLRANQPLSKTRLFNADPALGNFGIAGGKLVAPGDPTRSLVYYRMSKHGRGHMPHLGSDVVDQSGLALVGDWIQKLPTNLDAKEAIDRLDVLLNLDSTKPPTDPKIVAERALERDRLIQKLLSAPDSALMLVKLIERDIAIEPTARTYVERGLASANPDIRDLFERFTSGKDRALRLGSNVDPQKILTLTGNADKGRELFLSSTFQCGSCHQVAGKGGKLGPDLSDVAKRLSKTQIIESILTPSKTIDAKFQTHAIETEAGQVHTGLLVEKTATEIVLRVVGDKEIRVPLAQIAATNVLPTSLMPEGALREATAVQAGDLLAYLWSLK